MLPRNSDLFTRIPRDAATRYTVTNDKRGTFLLFPLVGIASHACLNAASHEGISEEERCRFSRRPRIVCHALFITHARYDTVNRSAHRNSLDKVTRSIPRPMEGGKCFITSWVRMVRKTALGLCERGSAWENAGMGSTTPHPIQTSNPSALVTNCRPPHSWHVGQRSWDWIVCAVAMLNNPPEECVQWGIPQPHRPFRSRCYMLGFLRRNHAG